MNYDPLVQAKLALADAVIAAGEHYETFADLRDKAHEDKCAWHNEQKRFDGLVQRAVAKVQDLMEPAGKEKK